MELRTLVIISILINYSKGDFFPKFAISGEDVTKHVFGTNNQNTFPLAFGDFNADKLTDVIAVNRQGSSILLYFAKQEAPYLTKAQECVINIESSDGKSSRPARIVGATPGDFTGDGLMDLLVTLRQKGGCRLYEVLVFRGDGNVLICSENSGKMANTILMSQEPTVADFDGNMIMDLVGESVECVNNTIQSRERKVWMFSPEKLLDPIVTNFRIFNEPGALYAPMAIPSSNSYVDIDGDFIPELVLITDESRNENRRSYVIETFRPYLNSEGIEFERAKKPFVFDKTNMTRYIGQSLFVDMNRNSQLLHLLPYKTKSSGKWGIKAVFYNGSEPVDIPLLGKTYGGKTWSFYTPDKDYRTSSLNLYTNILNLRAGDYNLDGYPDLVGTLIEGAVQDSDAEKRSVIFENVPCESSSERYCPFPRTFKLNFEAMKQYSQVSLSAFFDIKEDGLIDVLVVRKLGNETHPEKVSYEIRAFQNSPDYDANFIKVMVLSARACPGCPNGGIPYGNVIPGPVIKYKTTQQSGDIQTAVAAQMYRSAHMPMDLPYTIFGIGHSPNFVETLLIAVSNKDGNKTHEWPQIIPNSQIIVIPKPTNNPKSWIAKLFLTPSDAVLNTFGVLMVFCLVVVIMVIALHCKERREDRLERTQEPYPFIMG